MGAITTVMIAVIATAITTTNTTATTITMTRAIITTKNTMIKTGAVTITIVATMIIAVIEDASAAIGVATNMGDGIKIVDTIKTFTAKKITTMTGTAKTTIIIMMVAGDADAITTGTIKAA